MLNADLDQLLRDRGAVTPRHHYNQRHPGVKKARGFELLGYWVASIVLSWLAAGGVAYGIIKLANLVTDKLAALLH